MHACMHAFIHSFVGVTRAFVCVCVAAFEAYAKDIDRARVADDGDDDDGVDDARVDDEDASRW